MAMVGLFWITEDAVYVGGEPIGTTSGVRLTKDGVEGLGNAPDPSWGWDEVRGLEVRDVRVRSAARRYVSLALGTLYAAVTGDGDDPPPGTLRVETAAGTTELSFYPAIAGAVYTPVEYALSRTLLGRLTDDGSTLDELLGWRHEYDSDITPPQEEREALLHEWTGNQAA